MHVAPLAGAWIETDIYLNGGCYQLSHPLRVRGLKLVVYRHQSWVVKSHPLRVRGLKLKTRISNLKKSNVAPLAGAWIETLRRP